MCLLIKSKQKIKKVAVILHNKVDYLYISVNSIFLKLIVKVFANRQIMIVSL